MIGVIRDDIRIWDAAKTAFDYSEDQKLARVCAGKAAAADAAVTGISVEAPGSRKAPRTRRIEKEGQKKGDR